jgi:hypothetical protein
VRKPRRASLAIVAIAALAAATLAVEGGRAFGSRARAGEASVGAPGGAPSLDEGGARRPAPEGKGQAWLLAGPFRVERLSGLENALDRDYLASSGMAPSGEASAAPLRIGSSASKLWREAEGGAEEGDGVDFIAELGPSAYSVAYAYREVDATSSREVLLELGSDDGVKVWINGAMVLANHVRRALLPDEDSVVVSLAKGRNRVLVKVEQAEGEWGFKLRFAPLGGDRGPAPVAGALKAYPDDLAVPVGGTIRGAVMPKPAAYEGIGKEGIARVELLDASGAPRASADARVGGRFSLVVPAGLSGPLSLRARGLGALAGLASPATPLLAGDPAASAREGAALARSAAAAKAAARFAELPDPAATLELLARLLEGEVPAALGGFDPALQALAEIEAIAGPGGARAPFPRGLWRYAFTSALDGSVQPYSLYLPAGYRKDGHYGLAVYLHGATGNDAAAAASVAAAEPEDMLVLAPFCRGDLAYSGAGERDAIDAIDLTMKRYAIDADRVYLSGSSMGGFGTWKLAKLYPWKFAAAASFAGWTGLDMLDNLGSLPFLAAHGDADATIPFEPDKKAVEYLASRGGKASFALLPGAGHDAFGAWTAKEGPGRLLAWMRQFKRDPWPRSIKVRTTMPRAGRGAWASILGIANPPKTAAVDARIVDERHIAVDTDNVSAFELDLRHPGLAKGGRILVLADGVNLTADSGKASARFELGPEGRFVPAAPRAEELPANGGSGLAALFDAPLRIVYGRGKRGRAADEAAIAQALAEGLGRGAIGPVDIAPDSEAGKAEPRPGSATLLVGGPDENSVLAALLPKLPLAWKGGRFHSPDGKVAGAGLLLVCPDPEGKGRLLGVVALPMRGRNAANFALALLSPLSDQSIQDACGYGTPDAVILNGSGTPIWMGFFDWRWGSLKASGPK